MAGKTRYSRISNSNLRRAVALGLIAIASAGCSSDVARFADIGDSFTSKKSESTASIPDISRTRAAPLARVDTEPLAPPPVKPYGLAKHVTVEQGDTLFSLSRRHDVSIDEIAATNHLQKPYSVKVGQYLMIPAPGVPRTSWNKPGKGPITSGRKVTSIVKNGRSALPRNPAFSGRKTKSVRSAYHTVRSGETLYGISRKFGLKPTDLASYNNMGSNTSIRTGQKLKIPGRGGNVAVAKASVRRGVPTPRRAPALSRTRTAKSGIKKTTRTQKVAKATTSRVQARRKPVRITKLQNPPRRSYGKFRWPVKGRIISEFGRKTNGARNDGINFSVPMGASVKAAENGVVAYAGNELKGYGNLILIRHSGDWVTAYAHNSKLIVKHGQKVRRGDIIAKAGQTGSVSRPQLHFEVRKGAQAVNPRKFMSGAA